MDSGAVGVFFCRWVPSAILDVGGASVLEVAGGGVWDAKTFCASEALVDLVRCGFHRALKDSFFFSRLETNFTLPIQFLYQLSSTDLFIGACSYRFATFL